MKKKLLLSMIILTLTLVNGFAISANNSDQTYSSKRETLVGFSTNILNYRVEDNSNYIEAESSQMGLLLAEKITYYSDSNYNLTTSIGVNLTSYAQAFVESNENSFNTGLSDIESEYYQNSLNLFIGIEKSSSINKALSSSLSIGPNFQYVFENDDEDSSYYSYGIEGFADICYKISPTSTFNFGINATFNPFIGGDYVEDLKAINSLFDIDYTLYSYSVTPVISFSFSS